VETLRLVVTVKMMCRKVGLARLCSLAHQLCPTSGCPTRSHQRRVTAPLWPIYICSVLGILYLIIQLKPDLMSSTGVLSIGSARTARLTDITVWLSLLYSLSRLICHLVSQHKLSLLVWYCSVVIYVIKTMYVISVIVGWFEVKAVWLEEWPTAR
jgi:hypothetical protein